MSEEVPVIQLDLDGERFMATPFNAELFTFGGHSILENGDVIDNASRNHVFLKTGKLEDDVQTGTYVFCPETVQQLGAIMLQYRFPAKLYQTQIPESDENAYQRYIEQQVDPNEVEDFIPDSWLE